MDGKNRIWLYHAGNARFIWLGRIKGARPLLLSIRNTFRRKGRLILTVATLAVGGAILIVSLNVKSSLDNVLSPLGYALWLMMVSVITAIVGFGVTLKVLEMPVNEILSYE